MRATTLALLLVLVACGPSPEAQPTPSAAPESAREPVIHVHVPDKVADGQGRFKADWSFDLVTDSSWSAHVHVIPQGQLVPAHHHPENDELVFVAGGEAWWMGHHWDGTQVQSPAWAAATGDAVLSAAGSVHAVRNRESAPLATVVIQRPEFGQNWYLLPEEVRSPGRTGSFLPPDRGGAAPALDGPIFEGWSLDWIEADAAERTDDTDVLYLASAGSGELAFEEHALGMSPGTFARVPPGLAHGVRPGPDGLRLLRVRIPR